MIRRGETTECCLLDCVCLQRVVLFAAKRGYQLPQPPAPRYSPAPDEQGRFKLLPRINGFITDPGRWPACIPSMWHPSMHLLSAAHVLSAVPIWCEGYVAAGRQQLALTVYSALHCATSWLALAIPALLVCRLVIPLLVAVLWVCLPAPGFILRLFDDRESVAGDWQDALCVEPDTPQLLPPCITLQVSRTRHH